MKESITEVKKLRKHNAEEVEVMEIYIDENKHPVAYARKMKELQLQLFSEKEARKFILTTPFEMEFYYSLDQGLFLVETDAVENIDIYNPYTGEKLDEEIDE